MCSHLFTYPGRRSGSDSLGLVDIFHAREVCLVSTVSLLSFLLNFLVFVSVFALALVLSGFPVPTKAVTVSLDACLISGYFLFT